MYVGSVGGRETHAMVRRLRRRILNMAFSPSHHSQARNTGMRTKDNTAVAMTLPSFQGLVTPPHCMKRIKQQAHAIEIAAPSQSHFATCMIMSLLKPLYEAARPKGGVMGCARMIMANAMPPKGRLMLVISDGSRVISQPKRLSPEGRGGKTGEKDWRQKLSHHSLEAPPPGDVIRERSANERSEHTS